MFKYVVLLASIILAGCAAWFSVTGISQLFIGAHLAALIMAGSLELGKVVGVSFLYRYWLNIPKFLRTYMGIGAIVLMLITSLGIYGYLSSAYSTSAVAFNAQTAQIDQIGTRVAGLDASIERYENRVTQMQSFRNDQEERLNELTGRNGFLTQQSMVRQTEANITENQKIIDSLITLRDSLQLTQVVESGELNSSTKLGTFSYVANSLGVPLDSVVKWFILLIIFVFDPMAIALIMAYNFLVKKESSDLPNNPSFQPETPENDNTDVTATAESPQEAQEAPQEGAQDDPGTTIPSSSVSDTPITETESHIPKYRQSGGKIEYK